MADGKGMLLHAGFELIGCLILGFFASAARYAGAEWMKDGFMAGPHVYMYILPFLCWIPYMLCWRISNSHLNPAVTLVGILRKDYDLGIVEGLLYIIAQFLGFFFSNFFVWWFKRDVGSLKIWKENGDFQHSEAIGMETFGSFVFILVHTLQMSKHCSASYNWGLNSFIVGTFYGALLLWGSSVTGGSFNPAYGLMKPIVDSFDTGEKESIENIWIYVTFPFVAAFAVFGVYEAFYRKAFEDQENKQVNMEKTNEMQ